MSLRRIGKAPISCTLRALGCHPTTISSSSSSQKPSLFGGGWSRNISHILISPPRTGITSHLPISSRPFSTQYRSLYSSFPVSAYSSSTSSSFTCTSHIPMRFASPSSFSCTSDLPLSSSFRVFSHRLLSCASRLCCQPTISLFAFNFSASSKPSRSPPDDCESQVESSSTTRIEQEEPKGATTSPSVVASKGEVQHLTPEKRGQWKLMMNSSDKGSHSIPVLATVANGKDAADVHQEHKPVSMWPGMYHSPVTAALWAARSSIIERHLDFSSANGHPQRELLTRTPSQSRTSILYLFSSDKILQEQYRNPWSAVRIGKLLEDLDALAGTIAVKHCADDDFTTRPLMLVTASVDKISLLKPISITEDITIAGAVAWVGRSSMEIRMEVTQDSDEDDADSAALVANFTFVARDTVTKKAAQINRLLPETETEKKLFQLGEATDAKRKEQRTAGTEVSKAAKALYDDQRLKDLMTEGRVLRELPTLADRNTILMKDTKLENAIICQPQQRNMHGRIFGGFLMRRAYELAYSTCYVFCGTKPVFLEVDHVDFLRPVDVGDLLRFKSCVLYTEAKTQVMHIEVTAHVTQPELRSSEVSNTFYFTFTLEEQLLTKGAPPIFRVVPGTEEEARRVLARYDAENLSKYPLLEKQLSQKK